jgi:hypothetical protein
MSDERGFTLVELLVSMSAFIVVLGAILMMTTVATHNQDRIAKRVAANQRARPVMTRIIDNLHSACVAPRVAPVLAGSTGTSISFVSKSGSDVSPTPDRRQITLSGSPPTLSESVYPATGGAPPSWTFSTTPSSSQQLLTDVEQAPGVPVFRYYRFVGSQLSSTPLPTPLNATDAARTAHVSVTFTTAPSGGASSLDTKSPITISDSATMRLESASSNPAEENVPCV